MLHNRKLAAYGYFTPMRSTSHPAGSCRRAYDQKKAEKLMLEVHNDGKSVVASGSREEMERDVQAMHEYGLWATMEKES